MFTRQGKDDSDLQTSIAVMNQDIIRSCTAKAFCGRPKRLQSPIKQKAIHVFCDINFFADSG
ncbi:hypothetical protein PIB30_000259 [Stylosanthes scabra]|uniref:Uncharacterized protein n=1 Tax=Stylosanthes scabra TaxID=79078 RepID=A0ABU6S246_9FABA|nr:hypothetical protein [Stylosanthes scabra]